jgi:hypothetical protein
MTGPDANTHDTHPAVTTHPLLGVAVVACLVVVSFMSKVPTQYRQVTAAPMEAK